VLVRVTYNHPMASPASRPKNAAASPSTKRLYLGVQSINVYVRDQDRSLRFYLDQLGFKLAFDAKLQSGERWVAVSPPDGTAILALIAPKPDTPEYKFIGRATHVSFVTEDVTAKFLEWSKRGVRFSSTPRLKRLKYQPAPQSECTDHPTIFMGEESPIWGAVFARFRDIDGNRFALVSFDEFTHVLEMHRRTEAEKQEHERRVAQELEIAKRVQARLFPQTKPALRTLDYAGMCIQAHQVGGDYYDFLNLGQERLGLVLGDVSGKGIAAALLMANLQANLRSQVGIAVDQPERLLKSVNELFCDSTDEGAFASLFFAEYDGRAARLRYINCGHLCALLLRGNNSVERLEATSTLLGLFKEWDCTVGERQLFGGDTLALYTDGITEAFNDADEQFGEERLIEALQRHRNETPQNLLDAIVGEIQKFSRGEQHDDITLIMARCTSNTAL
jgi:serine phosphatase RsbU (regulator of sigma subunit)/catechol 2,3-dioxygenase-like lactoylglutathione lyase family enzyme